MVTLFPERAVPPLLKVAVKVTDWLTVGVVVDAVRVSVVDWRGATAPAPIVTYACEVPKTVQMSRAPSISDVNFLFTRLPPRRTAISRSDRAAPLPKSHSTSTRCQTA